MPARLVALDEGTDISLDRTMVVVGRHPQCDARLESLRVSRHHCCMTQDGGEVFVRDLGSTNGIRINGQRVETGRLRPGDELSIAHIRYRFENSQAHHITEIEEDSGSRSDVKPAEAASPFDASPLREGSFSVSSSTPGDNPLAAAVRELLPAGIANQCRIKVIVQMRDDKEVHVENEAE